ncbi:TIGR03621 family F420-dependent LLM class oxidoreductase [Nocardia sp. NPDC057227]|uniref:TIGR03621 family F420-dependent LLM class oxidoreductase n=1 Tax=Nocardia sp. NPDC057227 TaxID=3346056 RepID=UPI00362D1CD4
MSTVFDHRFRFVLCVFGPTGRGGWVEAARVAEQLGYDAIAVSDHLGGFAPVPTVAVIAEATERLRLAIYVSSSTLYRPRVLARDYATLDQYSGGRVEIGLGAGYSRAEFESAGVPWLPAGQRVTLLEHAVHEFRDLITDHAFRPGFVVPAGPPMVVAGRGDRVLRLAAEHADIIGFSGTAPVPDGEPLVLADPAEIRERVDYVRKLAGHRLHEIEFGIPVHRVFRTRPDTAITDVWGNEIRLGADELDEHPGVLIGSPSEIADKLVMLRARYGFSYFNVMESERDSFAEVIAHLR